LEVLHGTVLTTLCIDGAAHHLVDNTPLQLGNSIYIYSFKKIYNANYILFLLLYLILNFVLYIIISAGRASNKRKLAFEEIVESIDSKLNHLTQVAQYSLKNIYLNVNPWENMSDTQASRNKNLAREFELIYPKKCMFTGKKVATLAHILPFSTKTHICNSLGLKNKLDSHRNLMWLCPALKNAFDQLEISFVLDKSNPLLDNRYKMHVWKEEVLNNRLWEKHNGGRKSHCRIEHIKEKVMNLSLDHAHRPYRRCLSYQAYMAYLKWSAESNTLLSEPFDFDDSVYEGKFNRNELRQLFLDDRKKELADEEDDDEEDDIYVSN
jgi:hypothetical protein